ncbi:MAG: UDP-galactopyranose mutase [Pseudomonadota bacterium]
MKFTIVGAGFSGAVTARALAEAGHLVTVLDGRPHVAGNCHTERCSETGVLVHHYGPHIFHTAHEAVWAYVNRFAKFHTYRHQVKTTSQGAVFSLPISLHTINQFFDRTFRPEEARAYIETHEADRSIADPKSFEDQALRFVGPRLYDAFFKGYTEKQWGLSPAELPASILKRLPLRFDYNDNYFAHPYQGMPAEGYTALVENILDHPRIDVHLSTVLSAHEAQQGDHLVWTGPLDGYFDNRLGHLGYRTLDFERFTAHGDWQGCAVMNYADADVPWTRITEHKHFAPWEAHDQTVLYRETPRACGPDDTPYYPIRLVREKALLTEYEALAAAQENVTFLGRLGTYRYLDMDVSIAEAMQKGRDLIATYGTA